MKKTATLCLAVALGAFAAMAQDLKITFSEITSYPPRATPTGVVKARATNPVTSTSYYAGNIRRTNNEDSKQDIVVDYKGRVVYEVNHNTKTIAKFNFDDMATITELAKAKPKEAEIQFADEFFGKASDVKVKKGGTEKIAGRQCEKWEITVGKVVCKLSVDPSIYVPVPAEDFLAAMKIEVADMMNNSAINDVFTKLFEEIYKIKGTPLKMAISLTIRMGTAISTMTQTTTAKKVEDEPNMASALAIPKGYKLEDKGGVMVEQMRKGTLRPPVEAPPSDPQPVTIQQQGRGRR